MIENEEKRINSKVIKRLLKELLKTKGICFLAFICLIITTILTVATPKLIGIIMTEIYDEIIIKALSGQAMVFSFINKLLLLLTIVYIVQMIIDYFKNSIIANICQQYISNLRNQINNKLHELPIRHFNVVNNGEIISLLVNDMENVSNNLQNVCRDILTETLKVVAAIIMMALISPILTIAAMAITIISVGIIIWCSKISEKHFNNKQQKIADISENIEEAYSSRTTIQLFVQEDKFKEKFGKKNREYRDIVVKSKFMAALAESIFEVWQNVALAIIVVISAYLNINGKIAIGEIYTIMNYSKITMGSLKSVTGLIKRILNILASLKRIYKYIDNKVESEENGKIVRFEEQIMAEGISFGYDENKILLKDINMRIKRGKKIAIVGKTGSGKTTLANLLMKIYTQNTGNILCDNTLYENINTKEYMENFSVIRQDINGFEDTVIENIRYGNQNVSDEEIIAVAKRIGVHDSIINLEKGYETVLDNNISVGVKQMIILLQNIIADTQILVMDEATNMLDMKTKCKVNNIINNVAKEKTVIVIAHDLSVIKDADYVYVIDNGKIIEQGTHNQLINNNKVYTTMFQYKNV